jgi:hypothetical protein
MPVLRRWKLSLYFINRSETMLLRKMTTVLALTLSSGAAVAEWQLVGANGKEFSMFAELDAARKAGNVATVPELVTYGDPQPARVTGRSYVSEKSVVEYDCSAKRARVVSTEQYTGDRASGSVVFRQATPAAPWMPVPANTNMEVVLTRACSK